MHRVRTVLGIVIALAMLAACAERRTSRPLSFQDADGRWYDGTLISPARRGPGPGVLLIGGGSVTDQHWTVPGTFDDNGTRLQFTIDGRDTRDADTLAAALCDAGFCVLQWSSIHRDDALAAAKPGMAEPMPYARSVDVAARALALLRAQPDVDPEQVSLVGHSLGGTRAWQIADHRIRAIVTLAGAYLVNIRERPSDLAAAAWTRVAAADTNGDGVLDRAEWGAPAAEAREAFEEVDADSDGVVRGWELAARERIRLIMGNDPTALSADGEFRAGVPWACDRAALLRRPWLAVFGGLDPISMYGPLISDRRSFDAGPGVRVTYAPFMGHQLGPQEGDRTGPIDAGVVRKVVRFLLEHSEGAARAGEAG